MGEHVPGVLRLIQELRDLPACLPNSLSCSGLASSGAGTVESASFDGRKAPGFQF